MEMALWSLLGPNPVTMLAWESFGAGWITDVLKQLKLEADVRTADYGQISDFTGIDKASDVVFTWNGTTSGVRVPNGDWISDDRAGLTICDATSAAFAQRIDWPKIDVGTFSWQKALGGEGGHGMLVLSPRAVERLERAQESRALPKIFRLTKGGALIEGVFKGETINTPSMLAVEDWLVALDWADGVGGLDALIARADANSAALDRWVQQASWIEHLTSDSAIRSNTSVCLQFADRSDEDANKARQKGIVKLLEAEDAAYDIGAYRDAPPGLRVWCGATVETSDIEALGPWLPCLPRPLPKPPQAITRSYIRTSRLCVRPRSALAGQTASRPATPSMFRVSSPSPGRPTRASRTLMCELSIGLPQSLSARA